MAPSASATTARSSCPTQRTQRAARQPRPRRCRRRRAPRSISPAPCATATPTTCRAGAEPSRDSCGIGRAPAARSRSRWMATAGFASSTLRMAPPSPRRAARALRLLSTMRTSSASLGTMGCTPGPPTAVLTRTAPTPRASSQAQGRAALARACATWRCAAHASSTLTRRARMQSSPAARSAASARRTMTPASTRSLTSGAAVVMWRRTFARAIQAAADSTRTRSCGSWPRAGALRTGAHWCKSARRAAATVPPPPSSFGMVRGFQRSKPCPDPPLRLSPPGTEAPSSSLLKG
jgi:hypothetical protein